MSYSLLAHLFPRIKGSQEDVATYSLSYILEQSEILNGAFTRLITEKLCIYLDGVLSYHCQDADSEYGRPDIAGYRKGELTILCEAKFYAGLTPNQPVSYLRRLMGTNNSGVVFICPKERVISLWDKVCALAEEAGLNGERVSERCNDYNGTRMSIISWNEVLADLLRVATEQQLNELGDLQQLEGFCSKVESDAFIPFTEDDFSVQTVKQINRYYKVVSQVHTVLKTHKELSPSVKGLRNATRWEGFSAYIMLCGKGVCISYNRDLWQKPTSIPTPFWFQFKEIVDGKWVSTELRNLFMASIDSKYVESFYGEMYIALIPKPYQTLEELGEDLAGQIIDYLKKYEEFTKVSNPFS